MDFLKTFLPSFGNTNSKKKEYNPAEWSPMSSGSSDIAERNLLENNKEWVFLSVDKVAKGLSSVRFKVMKYRKGKDDMEVFDGKLVEFLNQPHKQLTGKQFFYLNTVYKELAGNAFWEVNDDKTLTPLIANCVSAIIDKETGAVTAYKYTHGTKVRTIALEKVLHDRYVDPKRPFWGVGKLEKIARWVDSNSYASEFFRLFFVNGAQFGGFIETDEESRERIELIKAGLLNEHTGVKNSHKIAVLPKGSKFAKNTANMADMQFAENDDRFRDKILAGFGVPKTLVGFTTEVNRASAEASEYIFAKYTIKPIAEATVEFLNQYVIPLFDKSNQFYFSFDEFVPENREILLKEREIALNKQQYKTINEVRAEEGLPPITGGDTIYGAPFGVPIGSPAAVESGKSRPTHVTRAASLDSALDKIVDAIDTKEKIVKKKSSEEIIEDVSNTEIKDAARHKEFVSRVDQHEQLLAGKIRDFNLKQSKEVVENLGRLTKAVKKGDIFDYDSEVEVLIDFVSPLLRGVLLEQAIDEYLDEEFPGTFDATAESISKIIETAAARMSRSYNDTTLVLLKRAINEGVSAGEGLPDIAKRVREVYEFSDKYRAKMVAHTETYYAANEGSKEAYRQSGVVKTIRWYTSEDERVCEFCAPLNGKVISIDENFYKKGETVIGQEGGKMTLDYRAMDVPPLHPNCNCFVRAEKIEVGQI